MSHTPLALDDIAITYDGRWVLDGISMTAPSGTRMGVVGENGSGKSTLLRIAAGIESPTRGIVHRPADTGYLAQDSGLDPTHRIGEVLQAALAPLHDAVRELEKIADQLTDPLTAARYDEVLNWATRHDAWTATQRAERAAAHLGLESLPQDQRVGDLSGGQRARLALAALIARRPDCVLLDEPTNHLDDQALNFLEAELSSIDIVVAASHDRTFLETVCTSLLDLDRTHFGTDGAGGRTYSGSYREYLAGKERGRIRWQEAFLEQQEQLNDLRVAAKTTTQEVAHNRGPRDGDKYIYGFKGARVQQTATRRRRNAEQRIEVLERELIPKPPKRLSFRADFGTDRPGWLTAQGARAHGRFHIPRLDVGPGEHWLITGVNGSGKSSFLSAVTGELALDGGTLEVHARRVGYLRQEVNFTDPARSPLDIYADTAAAVPLIELGLLLPRDLHRPVGELSLGTAQRLALAVLMAKRPDVVLLDEPTNHLALGLVEDLEDALLDAPATVVVTSHDRWLRSRWTGPALELTPPR